VHRHTGTDLDDIVSMIASLPLFLEERDDVLVKAVSHCSVVFKAPSEVLIEENTPCKDVYFIARGSVSISKTVKFYRKALRIDRMGRFEMSDWMAWSSNVILKRNDEISLQKIVYHKSGFGDAVPVIPFIPLIEPDLTCPYNAYSPYALSCLKHDDYINSTGIKFVHNYFTVTAIDPEGTVFIKIPAVEFLKLATHKMMSKLSEMFVDYRIPIKVLQEAYLQSGSCAQNLFKHEYKGTFKEVLAGLVKSQRNKWTESDFSYKPEFPISRIRQGSMMTRRESGGLLPRPSYAGAFTPTDSYFVDRGVDSKLPSGPSKDLKMALSSMYIKEDE
jgi:CRP-like cAMP-binding protein